MKKNIIKIITLIVLTLLLILNYSKNIFEDNSIEFSNFQSDSEFIVFSKIFQDKYNVEGQRKYGLINAIEKGTNKRVENIWNLIENYNEEETEVEMVEYPVNLGLQGFFYSYLYNNLNMPFWVMKFICCFLLAIIVISICTIIYKKYSRLMAVVFYITFLLSPWIVVFARNLYWIEFIWFLPMLLSLMISINYKHKKILVPCIFFTILIKCLCGYEYITTIMLSTIVFFVVDFFDEEYKEKRKEIFKTTIIVGISCLLAFALAICIHGIIRGDGNLQKGIIEIYEKDIVRRTIIDDDNVEVASKYKASKSASAIEVIKLFTSFKTNIILGIEGRFFRLMCIGTIAILVYNIINKKKNSYRDLVMFIMFLSTTLSWFILGKAHSYCHTHLNFVLWYFGFVQICLYIIFKFICEKSYCIGKAINEAQEEAKI